MIAEYSFKMLAVLYSFNSVQIVWQGMYRKILINSLAADRCSNISASIKITNKIKNKISKRYTRVSCRGNVLIYIGGAKGNILEG